MRKIVNVLALVLATAGTVSAQTVSVRTDVGVFSPLMPLVSVAAPVGGDVELGGAPAVGLELDVALTPLFSLYGGMTASFTRLHHSGAMELREVDNPASSRVNLFVPTGGVRISPRLGESAVRPVLRLGAGAKVYDFDLFDVAGAVADFTGDVGLGIAASAGAVSFGAEARWLPSRFNARNLPIPVMGEEMQFQNDWLFQIGLVLRP